MDGIDSLFYVGSSTIGDVFGFMNKDSDNSSQVSPKSQSHLKSDIRQSSSGYQSQKWRPPKQSLHQNWKQDKLLENRLSRPTNVYTPPFKSPRIGVVAPSQLGRPNRLLDSSGIDVDEDILVDADYLPPVSRSANSKYGSQEDLFASQHSDIIDTPKPLILQDSTNGNFSNGILKLRPVAEIPETYRHIFEFPYFNTVQSKVFDDVLYTDNPIVLCAPTGSGKTVVFELAIIRLLMQQHNNITSNLKVVYMAPIKALCSERYEDWNTKFGCLGLKCLELTGDTGLEDYFELQDVHIILTTPEKWDSMTRRWRDNKSLVHLVRLFFIDEVHMLNDPTRGATIEAVVSRMKTIQEAVSRQSRSPTTIRFVAVSATIPNVQDIADWLSSDGRRAVCYNMDESSRPVRLRKVVLGYPCSDSTTEFRFDLSLNYKLASVIETYAERKPALIFCATRKGTVQAASTLVKDAKFLINTQQKQRLVTSANTLKDCKLRELVQSGVGFHHAGMDLHDRKIIEALFSQGDLPVLMATTTLAMGVNLPAHLVVVKSTQHYVMGLYQEYTETQVLQMIGRAGRPQFDTTATSVIMTRSSTKRKYECLLNGTQMIESSLHEHLTEHLNAEIMLHTITDVTVALDWIKSTFLYIRVMKNPKHYGIPLGLSKERVEQKLQEMCLKNLNSLASIQLVKMDEDSFDLKPTETGSLMAKYCIAFETMKNFHQISGTENLSELLTLFCKSQEFEDIKLRVNEKRVLNSLNKDKNRVTIRFPLTGKIKNNEMKVNCLIQAQLGSLTVQEFALQQDMTRIFRAGVRIARCLVQMLWQRSDFKSLLNAVLLSKCLKARMWENSKHVCRQLSGIGLALSNALVNAGITTFQKIEERNPRNIEMIVNRHPPFGNQIRDSVNGLPKYELSIDQSNVYTPSAADITLTITITNAEAVKEKSTVENNHTSVLLVGDADNKVLYKVRISDGVLLRNDLWSKKITVRRAKKGEQISVNLISQDWAGLDVQSTYTPFYSGPKKVARNLNQQISDENLPWNDRDDRVNNHMNARSLSEGRKPCSHRCSNKDLCGHDCCKKGVPSRNKITSLDRHMIGLKHKMEQLPETPSIKKYRDFKQETSELPDLQTFAYRPKPVNQMPCTAAFSTTSTWDSLRLHEKRMEATEEIYITDGSSGDDSFTDFDGRNLPRQYTSGAIQNKGNPDASQSNYFVKDDIDEEFGGTLEAHIQQELLDDNWLPDLDEPRSLQQYRNKATLKSKTTHTPFYSDYKTDCRAMDATSMGNQDRASSRIDDVQCIPGNPKMQNAAENSFKLSSINKHQFHYSSNGKNNSQSDQDRETARIDDIQHIARNATMQNPNKNAFSFRRGLFFTSKQPFQNSSNGQNNSQTGISGFKNETYPTSRFIFKRNVSQGGVTHGSTDSSKQYSVAKSNTKSNCPIKQSTIVDKYNKDDFTDMEMAQTGAFIHCPQRELQAGRMSGEIQEKPGQIGVLPQAVNFHPKSNLQAGSTWPNSQNTSRHIKTTDGNQEKETQPQILRANPNFQNTKREQMGKLGKSLEDDNGCFELGNLFDEDLESLTRKDQVASPVLPQLVSTRPVSRLPVQTNNSFCQNFFSRQNGTGQSENAQDIHDDIFAGIF